MTEEFCGTEEISPFIIRHNFVKSHQQAVSTLNISFPDQSTRRLKLYCEMDSGNAYNLQVAGEDVAM